jgi:hypothetical protein
MALKGFMALLLIFSEELFRLGNIAIIPRYRFEKKGKWIEFPMAIQIPTLNKRIFY